MLTALLIISGIPATGWLLDWNQTPLQNLAPVLTTTSSGSNYRTPEDHHISLPVSKPVTPPLNTTTTTPQSLAHSCSTLGITDPTCTVKDKTVQVFSSFKKLGV
jgi:hypothetical protein